MGTDIMGRVQVAAKIENLADLLALREGRIAPEEVRTVEVDDALVDTGATILSLHQSLIDQLGLVQQGTRRARTATGPSDIRHFDAVRLTIQGRDCTVDVAGLPDECPALIGQVPLELLDFVVDPRGQRLIGNPEHGGKWMIDLF